MLEVLISDNINLKCNSIFHPTKYQYLIEKKVVKDEQQRELEELRRIVKIQKNEKYIYGKLIF